MNDRDDTEAPGDGLARQLRDRVPTGLRWVWPIISRLYGFPKINRAVNEALKSDGEEFATAMLESLGVSFDFRTPPGWRLPGGGPLIIVANHHFGAIDALGALSFFRPVRPGVRVLAYRNLSHVKFLADTIIPVDTPNEKRPGIRGLRHLLRHLSANGAVIVFPAGRVAGWSFRRGVDDYPWTTGVARLAHMAQADIVTLSFSGRNSALFYLLRWIHFSLAKIRLPREQLNKRNRRFGVEVSHPIPFADFRGMGIQALTRHLREKVYAGLAADE